MEVNGKLTTNFNDVEIDLGKWRRFSMREAIIEKWPQSSGIFPNTAFQSPDIFCEVLSELSRDQRRQAEKIREERARNFALTQQADDSTFVEQAWHEMCGHELDKISAALKAGNIELGAAIAEAFENLSERDLIQPTIIYDFPLAVSPLSKQKPDEPDWVERFEFYIGGFELGNAFSELNDPEEQRKRFEMQLAERERGDEEAHQMDEDYVRALAYGLPPTAGEGIGIDRLTMVLTGAKSIRDVILFPLLRPQKKSEAESAE
jgi:lysyl-tRNA synthetase class 2